MTSREQFEAWVRGELFHGITFSFLDNGEYVNSVIQVRWEAWQASRAAIEIELPEPFALATNPQGNTYYYESEVDEAIESAGLKVKK